MSAYRRLWAVPGAPTLLVGGVVARLGQGVTVIAWLLLLRQTRGSFADAALVTSVLAAATALVAPLVGRLCDRRSASRVLPGVTAAYVVTQLTLLAAVHADAPLPLLLGLAALTGAVFPPVSAALRATWSFVTAPGTAHGPLQSTAMAAESALFELAFVVGPLLLSASVMLTAVVVPDDATAGPTAALLLATVTTLGGATWLTRGRAMRGVGAPAADRGVRGSAWGPLRSPGFPLVLLTAAGVMFGFGVAPVALAAYAEQRHGAAGGTVTGVLIAVWSLGSAAAGLVFGSLQITAALRRQYVVLLAGLSAGYLVWVVAPTTLWLAVALALTGGVIAPALAVMAGLVAELTPASTRNEAYTWLTTTSMGVSALGSAVAGFVVDGAGAGAGFVLAAAATTVGLVTCVGLPRAEVPRMSDVRGTTAESGAR